MLAQVGEKVFKPREGGFVFKKEVHILNSALQRMGLLLAAPYRANKLVPYYPLFSAKLSASSRNYLGLEK